MPGGFAGLFIDLYAAGAVIRPLQYPATWEAIRGKMREGGKIMINCGCGGVEGEQAGGLVSCLFY